MIDPVTGVPVFKRVKIIGGASRRAGNRLGVPLQPRIFKCHLESCAKIFNDRASLKKHMTVHGDKLVSDPQFLLLVLMHVRILQ